MKKTVLGTTTSPKLRLRLGRWYLEIGKVIKTFTTSKELADGIMEAIKNIKKNERT